MSGHQKGPQLHGDFCGTHLRFVLACADGEIESALAEIPDYDLGRLRRILAKPVPAKGVTRPDPGHQKAS
jgi:hypothetical protein